LNEEKLQILDAETKGKDGYKKEKENKKKEN
jgi:hypothetical protein